MIGTLAHSIPRGSRVVHRLVRCDRGAALPFIAFVSLAMFGAAALAVETSGWYAGKRSMQRIADTIATETLFIVQSQTSSDIARAMEVAADRAIAMGVTGGTGVWSSTNISGTVTPNDMPAAGTSATSLAAAQKDYSYTKGGITITYDYDPADVTAVDWLFRATARSDNGLSLGNVVSSQSVVQVAATGSAAMGGPSVACIVGLSTTSGDSVVLTGTADINLNGCEAQSNDDLKYGGDTDISGVLEASGSVSSFGNSTSHTGSTEGGVDVIVDPFASEMSAEFATVNALTSNNTDYECNGTLNGTTLNQNLVVTPGKTCIVSGTIYVAGNVMIKGTLTGTNATIVAKGWIASEGGSASISLNKGATGTSPNVVLATSFTQKTNNVADPGTFTQTEISGYCKTSDNKACAGNGTISADKIYVKLAGTAAPYLNGAFYSPNATMRLAGGSQSAGCTQLVAYTVVLQGTTDYTYNGANCPTTGGTPTANSSGKMVLLVN